MILVTVGQMGHFDRLIDSMDRWAEQRGRKDVFAQIGRDGCRPQHIEWVKFLPPDELHRHIAEADLLVAHAGMGTILIALEAGTRVVVLPRKAAESRGDHQMATARALSQRGIVEVVWDEDELWAALDRDAPPARDPLLEPPERVQLRQRLDDHVRGYDGVLCFGGVDWWYHNRGHYDVRMMLELSRRLPVLYVNSIGMRMPSVGEGGMFLRRVSRKLRSFSRRQVEVEPQFSVASPITLPGALGRLSAGMLSRQIRRGLARCGIRRPLVWVACPPAQVALEGLEYAGLVYQRTDQFEAYPGVDTELIRSYDQRLKEQADVTVFCNHWLFEEERGECRHAVMIDHGVDDERFIEAGDRLASTGAGEPEDMRDIPRPRAGFVGGVDAHTFDPALYLEVVRQLPEVQFVLVGGRSIGEDWPALDNLHWLGRKHVSVVGEYMGACDVLLMPWRQGDWIRACNPVKLKEYLGVGRPIVSTPFPELDHYRGLVAIEETATGFAAAVSSALQESGEVRRAAVEARRARVRGHGWGSRAELVVAELSERGVRPARPLPDSPESASTS